MWDDPVRSIDARIDAAARRMTDRPPPADLRIRIVERIASGERPRSLSFAWILAPAAIAMLVVAILLGLRAGHSRLPNAPPTAAHHGTPPAPQPAATSPAAGSAASSAIGRPRAMNVRAVSPPTPQAGEPLPELQVTPLVVDPIQLLPIESAETTPPEVLGLTRLTVTPLAFEGEG